MKKRNWLRAEEMSPGSMFVMVGPPDVNGSYAMLTRDEALDAGYEIVPAKPKAAEPEPDFPRLGPTLARQYWRKEIMQSRESKGRDSAVAELLVKHSPETLSADNARAFLRGLPIEQSERKETTMSQNNVDPRAARKAEISASMQAFNRNNGYAARQAGGAKSPSAASVDPVKLKRLAEIRLNALESGQAQDLQGNATSRRETTKLRYALQVHGQTGKPLAEVFAQLGVDTSKIVR